MTKLNKKKSNLHKQLDLEASKLGIRFYPGVSIGVKQAILECEKESQCNKAIRTTHEDLIKLIRSL